jgi:hypothetical protein
MTTDVTADALDEEQVVQIRGGNDKVPHEAWVLTHGCVCLLLGKGLPGPDQGKLEKDSAPPLGLPSLPWDVTLSLVSVGRSSTCSCSCAPVPRCRGLKRASRICRLVHLSREEMTMAKKVRNLGVTPACLATQTPAALLS